MAILIFLSVAVSRNIKFIPSGFQSIMEVLIDGLHTFFESVVGHQVKMLFPLIASLFLFILVSNWIGLLPGVGTVGFFRTEQPTEVTTSSEAHGEKEQTTGHLEETAEVQAAETESEVEFIPLFRGPTADLNTTIALALVAFGAIQFFGFKLLGKKYTARFVNFKNPIMGFVGLLELVSDVSKVISFAFRLFGNVFAGEVLLSVMAFLMPFVAPMPFLALELFVGFIQALVFSTLTAVFVNVAASHEG